MTDRLRVLVTGATGAVGPRVVEALCDAGCAVRTISIDPPSMVSWPRDVETVIGDVTDESAVKNAMRGVDVVIHLAALLHIIDPPLALKERYERINVGGTSVVTVSAIQSGVQRIVFFSTIAVYGQSKGQILTEDSPTRPDTFYALTKLAAEDIVLEARSADGRQIGTVLRLGAVYGSKIKGNYYRLVQSLAKGRFLPIGNGSNRRTLIYDKDVAYAALLVATHPAAAGKIFNVSDGHFHTMAEIIETICSSLGRKPPKIALPISAVSRAAGILEKTARIVGLRSPIGKSTINKYTEDIAVSGERIGRELEFVPQYDLSKGWQETVRDMREIGSL